MKTLRILLPVFLMLSGAILFCSCISPVTHCIRGNDDLASETRIPDENFTGVIHQGSFRVYITQDTLDEIRVEAEENLLDYIITRIEGNDLILKYRDNRCIRENHPIRIYIKTVGLDRIKLSGSGRIECDNIVVEQFVAELTGSGDMEMDVDASHIDASISGSGDIYFTGNAEETDFGITGSGKINAYSMPVDKCFATISGSGDMYLDVSELLDVKITGSGDVHYSGNPVVNTSITGSGSVIHN